MANVIPAVQRLLYPIVQRLAAREVVVRRRLVVMVTIYQVVHALNRFVRRMRKFAWVQTNTRPVTAREVAMAQLRIAQVYRILQQHAVVVFAALPVIVAMRNVQVAVVPRLTAPI